MLKDQHPSTRAGLWRSCRAGAALALALAALAGSSACSGGGATEGTGGAPSGDSSTSSSSSASSSQGGGGAAATGTGGGPQCGEVSAPTIGSSSGTVAHGNTITLEGCGFSTKRDGQLLADFFEDGTVGDNIAARGKWSVWPSAVVPYSISTDNPLSGTKHARCTIGANANPNTGGADDFGNLFVFPEDEREIYVEYAFYLDLTKPGPTVDGAQIKFGRVTPGAKDPTISPMPQLGMTRFNDESTGDATSALVFQSGGEGLGDWYLDGALLTQGVYHKLVMYTKLSSAPGAVDGLRYSNLDGIDSSSRSDSPMGSFSSPDGPIANKAWNGSPLATLGSGTSELWKKFHLPFYKRQQMELTMDIGYVYLNDSPERVVVCDSSDFYSATKRQTQPQISRTASAISFRYQQADLPASGPLWAFVVNADNTISAGYQVR